MPVKPIDTLKGYFAKGRVPTESNYKDLIDTLFSLEGEGNIIGPDVSIDGHLLVFDGVDGHHVRDGGLLGGPYISKDEFDEKGLIPVGIAPEYNWATEENGCVISVKNEDPSHTKDNINDGNNTTYWRPNGYDETPYIIFDLGIPRAVTKFHIHHDPAWAFYLSYSDDEINWTQIYEQTTGVVELTITLEEAITARYWLIQCFYTGQWAWQVYEALVYGFSPNYTMLQAGEEGQVLTILDSEKTVGWHDPVGGIDAPESVTDGNLVVFDGTDGKKVKDGGPITELGDATSLQGNPISATTPTEDQILAYQSGEWVPADPPSGTGGSTKDILLTIMQHFDPNSDPVDFCDTSISNVVILGYFGSHNANSWKPATNAVYTVPAGKTLAVFQWIASTPVQGDYSSRRSRLYDVTNGVEFIRETVQGITWWGDLGNTTSLPQLAAGTQVRAEIWNSDGSRRAIGGVYICMLLPFNP